jgi:TPR repeat protein
MFALGALYAGGHDVPEDRAAAQRWSRAAAALGHGRAQLMLGRYLAEGAAGEPDPAEARSWLEQAAAQGIEEAQADLAALHPPALQ